MSELLVITAFLTTYALGRHSAGNGLASVIWCGGFYGIIRANNLDISTYFLYDAAVLGLYFAQWPNLMADSTRTHAIRRWAMMLLFWPFAYLGIGFIFPQHPLVQLVGLRAAIWFVPFIMVGAQLTYRDAKILAINIAILNLVSFAFALAEFVLGVELFYPRNSATEIIYMSKDIAGFTAYRIPATFSSAASYGTFLVAGFPFLVTRLASRDAKFTEKTLMFAALLSAMGGVFMCGSRSPVVALSVMFIVAGFLLRRRLEILVLMFVIIGFVIYQVSQDERLQRVSTLFDTDATLERVSASARLGVFDVIGEYPFGKGLGSAFGTNIPSFLAQYQIAQLGAENEMARIALEQSVVGVVIWLSALFWIIRQRMNGRNDLALRLLTAYVIYCWATSLLGTGLLAAIPQTAMLFSYMGLCAVSWRTAPVSSGPHPASRTGARLAMSAATP